MRGAVPGGTGARRGIGRAMRGVRAVRAGPVVAARQAGCPRVVGVRDAPFQRSARQGPAGRRRAPFHGHGRSPWKSTGPAEDEHFYEAMQFDDDRRLAALVGDEVYSRLRQELGAAALPEEVLARTKPWAALLRIATARGMGDGPTLDRSLFIAARERRMTMLGLEWLDEQVAAFEAIPIETQIALLRHALDHAELEAQIENHPRILTATWQRSQ